MAPAATGADTGSGAETGSTAGSGAETGSGAGSGSGTETGSGSGADSGAGASPGEPIRAKTWPTSTRSPSPARISVTTPATGAGTSESTLSVEISKRISSTSTESPTCLNQRMIVPSVTVSPNWGMVTSTTDPASTKPHRRLPDFDPPDRFGRHPGAGRSLSRAGTGR